jgi:hypothetical protein
MPLLHARTLAGPTAPPDRTSWWMNLYEPLLSGSPSGSTQAYAFRTVRAGASRSLVSALGPDHMVLDVSVEWERIGPPDGVALLPSSSMLPPVPASPTAGSSRPQWYHVTGDRSLGHGPHLAAEGLSHAPEAAPHHVRDLGATPRHRRDVLPVTRVGRTAGPLH